MSGTSERISSLLKNDLFLPFLLYTWEKVSFNSPISKLHVMEDIDNMFSCSTQNLCS